MKRIKSIFTAVFLMSAIANATGGDHVNNGGGLSERNILFAYEKMGKYIQLCLHSETCKLTTTQREILEKIQAGLPREKVRAQIEFASEKNLPGYFIIDGRVRLARTGSTVGSVIIINVDMLDTKNESGGVDPMSIAEGVSLLVHEFGHHYGSYSHEELDLLGVRVSMMLQQKMIVTPMIPWTSEISAQVFNPDLSSFPDVLLTVGDEVIDISKQYRQAVKCIDFKVPIPVLPIPDIVLASSAPESSMLHNVHWDKIKESETSVSVKIIGNVSNRCSSQNEGPIRLNNSKLLITFTINKKGSRYVFDQSTLSVSQFKDPWWKFIKLPM
jgi:predicted Zn-dependent protease with MMP-like domain